MPGVQCRIEHAVIVFSLFAGGERGGCAFEYQRGHIGGGGGGGGRGSLLGLVATAAAYLSAGHASAFDWDVATPEAHVGEHGPALLTEKLVFAWHFRRKISRQMPFRGKIFLLIANRKAFLDGQSLISLKRTQISPQATNPQ
jgi:hypothetical protein